MTTGELRGGLGDDAWPPAGQRGRFGALEAPAVAEILDLTDRILGEPGRRSHLFTWLRRPEGGPADWLPVDAYYPGKRVVVVCDDTAGPYRDVFAELVPAHGLHLLEVDRQALPADRAEARSALQRRIAELGPMTGRATAGPAKEVARAAPMRPPKRQRPAGERQAAGVLAGLALAAVLVAEIYAGVARAGFDSGNLLLAFGLALDVCARGAGTIAASRTGSSEWALWCALGGSPVVVWFALLQDDGPVRTEPAPLAGLVGILALVVLAVALVAAAI